MGGEGGLEVLNAEEGIRSRESMAAVRSIVRATPVPRTRPPQLPRGATGGPGCIELYTYIYRLVLL